MMLKLSSTYTHNTGKHNLYRGLHVATYKNVSSALQVAIAYKLNNGHVQRTRLFSKCIGMWYQSLS